MCSALCGVCSSKGPWEVFSACIAHDLDAKQLNCQLKEWHKAHGDLPTLSNHFGSQSNEQSVKRRPLRGFGPRSAEAGCLSWVGLHPELYDGPII